jgi:mRNA-degrading endonuclease toxin of MazEF toxin-antitoxin module
LDFNLFGTQGHEQREPRPAVVLSSRTYNTMNGLCVIAPVTSHVKGYPFEVPIPEGCGLYGAILADQARTIDWVSRKVAFAEECIGKKTINKAADLYYSIIRDETEDDYSAGVVYNTEI